MPFQEDELNAPRHPRPSTGAERTARRIVAGLLDDDDVVARLDRICPTDDCEFGRSLADHELTLMANGYAASEVTLRLTVIRVAREALRIRAAIAGLEEPATREPGNDPLDRSTHVSSTRGEAP